MLTPFSSGCSVNRPLDFILVFLKAQEGEGFLLFWAKEILGALLILALF